MGFEVRFDIVGDQRSNAIDLRRFEYFRDLLRYLCQRWLGLALLAREDGQQQQKTTTEYDRSMLGQRTRKWDLLLLPVNEKQSAVRQ